MKVKKHSKKTPEKTINHAGLDWRHELHYEINSPKPVTGRAVSNFKSGQKKRETTYLDGDRDGLSTGWYENGQKEFESTYKDGYLVEITAWDDKGNVKN